MINKITNWSKGAPSEDGMYLFRVPKIGGGEHIEMAEVEGKMYLTQGDIDFYSLEYAEIIEHAKLEIEHENSD